MPPLVRRYVKTSFVFLMVGLVLGAYIVVAQPSYRAAERRGAPGGRWNPSD